MRQRRGLGAEVNRRGFLGSILTLAAAPAIVRADSLMRIVPVETLIDTRPVVDVAALEEQIRRRMRELKGDLEAQLLSGVDFYESSYGMARAPYKQRLEGVELWVAR